MSDIDRLVAQIMREMGCDPKKPPHWVVKMHHCKDQTTGEVYRSIRDGYICSRCGKHSYAKKDKCDGCGSVMQRRGGPYV